MYITDWLDNTSPTVAARERFEVLRTAGYGEVLRGVSFAPGSERAAQDCAERCHEDDRAPTD